MCRHDVDVRLLVVLSPMVSVACPTVSNFPDGGRCGAHPGGRTGSVRRGMDRYPLPDRHHDLAGTQCVPCVHTWHTRE